MWIVHVHNNNLPSIVPRAKTSVFVFFLVWFNNLWPRICDISTSIEPISRDRNMLIFYFYSKMSGSTKGSWKHNGGRVTLGDREIVYDVVPRIVKRFHPSLQACQGCVLHITRSSRRARASSTPSKVVSNWGINWQTGFQKVKLAHYLPHFGLIQAGNRTTYVVKVVICFLWRWRTPATRKSGWNQLPTAPSMASVSLSWWSAEFCLLHAPITSQESIFSDDDSHTKICSKNTRHSTTGVVVLSEIRTVVL